MPADLDEATLVVQSQMCKMLLEAPRSQAIGAALAFLLHCRDVDRVKLRAALRADAVKTGHRSQSILRLLQDA